MSSDGLKIGAAVPQPPASVSASRKDGQVARETAKEPQAKAAAVDKPAPQLPPQKIEAVAQRIDSYLRSVNRSLEFRVDDASGKTVVSVRDSQTGDLIRQFPGDEVLRLAEMAEDQTIVLVNESV